MTATFQPTDIQAIVENIWTESMATDSRPGAATGSSAEYAASVELTGEWQATVTIQCSRGLAQHAATKLGFDGMDLEDDEILVDVAGELANLVAGGLKSFAPASCSLSPPTTCKGSIDKVTPQQAVDPTFEGDFTCNSTELFHVRVVSGA